MYSHASYYFKMKNSLCFMCNDANYDLTLLVSLVLHFCVESILLYLFQVHLMFSKTVAKDH